ncbi:hypothetical protein [Sagittula sp.]|uniref:hypothetical protein n=1 Tax=Sagittula sp. TaxID=2038081 RepID=UPI0035195F8D
MAFTTILVPRIFILVVIALLRAVVIRFQPLTRLVQHILQSLVYGRLATLALDVLRTVLPLTLGRGSRRSRSLLAKVIFTEPVQLVNCRLAVAPGVLLHDLFQPLARVIAAFRLWRIVLIP